MSEPIDLEALPATYRAEAERVLGFSRFVKRTLARDTGLLADLIGTGRLAERNSPDHYQRMLGEQVGLGGDEASTLAALRDCRNREMLRIAWRDIAGRADLDETLADLSALADACLQHACAWLRESLREAWGLPFDADSREQQLLVVAMGKLGGGELNFSSDIDLIYVYPDAGDTAGGRRQISNHEYFDRFSKGLTKLMGSVQVGGFVFRVDTRLRPFGGSGPIAVSLAMLEDYLISQARTWERYAWIKARAVTGTAEDRARLTALIRPFVFRRYLDFSAIESIRTMKAAIEREHENKGIEANVKLGPGGIREVEFIGQVLQLLYGGREPRLQLRPIQAVLGLLADSGHLPRKAADALIVAYRFLRVLENRLQQIDDQQTHLLPDDEAQRAAIAEAMQWPDAAALMRHWHRHRAAVSAQFSALITTEGPPPASMGQSVWRAESAAAAQALLHAAGFDEAGVLGDWLIAWRDTRGVAGLSEPARANLDKVLPSLLDQAVDGVDAGAVVRRVVSVLSAVLGRPAYLALIVERPETLSVLIRLARRSRWVVEQIHRQPLLLDDLLAPAPGPDDFTRSELQGRWVATHAGLDARDEEWQLDRLREFRHSEVLRVATADLLDGMPLPKVSDALSAIAETVIRQALALAWQHLSERYGEPQFDGRVAQFAILAFGKLGGRELGYSSDLDLVFVHDELPGSAMTSGQKPIAAEIFFHRLARKFIHYLSAPTRAGRAYDIDTRLRPNGASGLMVTSIGAFERYQRESAWTWEHQALIRARLIVGHGAIAERFQAVRTQVLCAKRDARRLRADLLSMRAKMRAATGTGNSAERNPKSSPGGVTDCEFMVQYLVLRDAAMTPSLVEWTDNLRLLGSLSAAGSLSSAQADRLRLAYLALRGVIHGAALQDRPPTLAAGELVAEQETVKELWHSLFGLWPGQELTDTDVEIR